MFLSLDGNLNLKCVAVGPINSFVALSVASLSMESSVTYVIMEIMYSVKSNDRVSRASTVTRILVDRSQIQAKVKDPGGIFEESFRNGNMRAVNPEKS